MRHFRPRTVLAPLGNPWRYGLLLLLTAGSLALILSQPPIGQDLSYHRFADQRGFFGIPHTFNVISNIPFLIVGICGIRVCLGPQKQEQRTAWLVFFTATVLVSAGSAGYHWNPVNTTLMWDRLPMAIGFMCLLVAILGEHVSARLATILLPPAILLGTFSVLYWHLTDDLRFYAWVQFFPLIIIPPVILLFRNRYSHRWFLPAAFACYLLAKFAELYDRELFALTHGFISGHSLKHLLAAAGLYVLVLMLRRRRVFSAQQNL